MPGDSDDALPGHLKNLPARKSAQELELRKLFAEQEHRLRQSYGDWLLWLLGAQFLVADAVFVAFARIGKRWDLPADVIEVWLVATVVQVVGVVAIVSRHLFPNRDGSAAGP
jgi:glutathione S-transferase